MTAGTVSNHLQLRQESVCDTVDPDHRIQFLLLTFQTDRDRQQRGNERKLQTYSYSTTVFVSVAKREGPEDPASNYSTSTLFFFFPFFPQHFNAKSYNGENTKRGSELISKSSHTIIFLAQRLKHASLLYKHSLFWRLGGPRWTVMDLLAACSDSQSAVRFRFLSASECLSRAQNLQQDGQWKCKCRRMDDRYITKTGEDLFSFGSMKISDLHPWCQTFF